MKKPPATTFLFFCMDSSIKKLRAFIRIYILPLVVAGLPGLVPIRSAHAQSAPISLVTTRMRNRLFPENKIHTWHHWHYLQNGREITIDSCEALMNLFIASEAEWKKAQHIKKRSEIAFTITAAPAILFLFADGGNYYNTHDHTGDLLLGILADLALATEVYFLFRIGYHRHLKKAIQLYNEKLVRENPR